MELQFLDRSGAKFRWVFFMCWTGMFAQEVTSGPDQDVCGSMSADAFCENNTVVTDTEVAVAEGPRLRWRGFPYRVKNPVFARKIYGGGYVEEAFKDQGFDGLEEGENWDVLWTHRPQELSEVVLPPRPKPRQRVVNHCHYFNAAGDKCSFARHTNNVLRIRRSQDGPRYLRSFELGNQEQLTNWREAVLAQPKQYWLLKPCGGGASKGIKVHSGQNALDAQKAFASHSVAQEYLHDYFLGFGGHKFHLRLYFVVTRWSPTGVYLYDDGLVFRSVHAHDAKRGPSEERDVFSSISKSVEALRVGELWQHIDAPQQADSDQGAVTAAVVRTRISEVIREILGAAQLRSSFGEYGDLDGRRGFGCFDIFGADILLDAKLQPFVMEFNIGPNLWTTDHGEGHEQLLASVKQPFMQQVTRWAALRSGNPPLTVHAAESIEATALKTFSRII